MSTPETAPSPAAVQTANWWAQQIGAPTFDNGLPIAGMMADMLAVRHPTDAGSAARFAELLAATIQDRLDRQPNFGVSLSVDYGPDRELADAARAAGVSTARFPWKTDTWTYPQYATAKLGTDGRTVLVWASEEWLANRPTCQSQAWDESRHGEDYHGEPFACSLPLHHDGDHSYTRPIQLCTQCGRPDGWYHNEQERGHMPDFHTFQPPADATSASR